MSTHRDITHLPAAQSLIKRLSPEEQEQAADLMDYLDGCARTGHVPEGSIASVLNRQTPAVREAFSTLSELLETPRLTPFTPKMSESDHANLLDLDPDVTTHIKAAIDGQYVAASLQDRMGTDANREPEPLTTRDVLSAAYDAHTEGHE